ncbi:hypothetical protein Ahy_A08g040925 [Arachis hypogaea]|uniref:Uncharacterized protein n=1 Tax=Arachis hypogaea TaxID=3818 RepID=A0A445C134_ARAHY|nr:hypothetical protein Ahy_A08g040925 [Arachis hypogaea]
MYVMLNREKGNWILSRFELRPFHPCSTKKSFHYHEYRDLTMHTKCVIKDNDEADIRPNKTYLALTNEEQKKLEDDVPYPKRVIPCVSCSTIEKQFQQ